MKITNKQLKQIIKEELENVMMEMEDYNSMDEKELYDELERSHGKVLQTQSKDAFHKFRMIAKKLLKINPDAEMNIKTLIQAIPLEIWSGSYEDFIA